MTSQEVFNRVVRHLLTQNEQSKLQDMCCYRLEVEDGKVLKCAVGCLIPDEHYDIRIEGAAVLPNINGSTRLLWNALNKSGIARRHERLLSELQHCHDDFLPSLWRWKLERIAAEYCLKMPESDA